MSRRADAPLVWSARIGAAILAGAIFFGSFTDARAPIIPSSARVVGGNAAEKRLLRHILAGMGETRISRIEIHPASLPWRSSPRAIALKISGPRPFQIRATWEAWLVAGAFLDLSARRSLPPASVLELPGGDTTRLSGLGRATRPPRATSRAAARLRRRVRVAAARVGAPVVALTTPHPYGLGLAVVLRAGHPAAFLKYRLRRFLGRFAAKPQYEGTYFEVVDAAGRFVWAWAYSRRLSAGVDGVRAALAGCNPVTNLGDPVGSKKRRCPA